MANVTFSAVTEEDMVELAANMRQADRDEIAAQGTADPLGAVRFCCAASNNSWTAKVDGRVACIFGVGCLSILYGIGAPWMLGTDLVAKNTRAFIVGAGPYITRMLALYPVLTNVVDARNKAAIRWLKKTGFSIAPAEPLGVGGALFHPFEMKA